MTITFSNLVVGEEYERPYLAKLWGYRDWHGIGRGIVTPANDNKIILFITKEKQQVLTQYTDDYDGDMLFIEGERNHGSDDRLINSNETEDEIYLFYRNRHHSPFVFYGEVFLETYEKNTGVKPSVFLFRTKRSEAISKSALTTEKITHGEVDEDYIPKIEGRKKITKHIAYERSSKNRAKAIQIHGVICKICGFDFNKFYGAGLANNYIEIHHIESITRRVKKIDPARDLIPVCSNCHSMLHRCRNKVLSVKEIKKLIKEQKY